VMSSRVQVTPSPGQVTSSPGQVTSSPGQVTSSHQDLARRGANPPRRTDGASVVGCWTIQQRAVSVRQIRHDSLICNKRNVLNSFWVKILKFFDADPGSGLGKFGPGIWDGKKSDPGSRINIPDPQHWISERLLAKRLLTQSGVFP
jgi:hypothetical protein